MNEQNQKFRNRIGVKSSVPGLATVLCVLALGCVLAAFWPAMFADADAPNGGTALVLHIVYGTLSVSYTHLHDEYIFILQRRERGQVLRDNQRHGGSPFGFGVWCGRVLRAGE